MELNDTIVALSSATGGGGRAVVRLSGPASADIAHQVFAPWPMPGPTRRRWLTGTLCLSEVAAPLPAHVLYWPAPRTYTGQELVELHTLACPPLTDLLIADLLRKGGRAALPGEFTLRAFLAGKLDLPRAEAVLGVIEAGNRDDLKQALAQLAGGLTRPLDGLRDDLLNLLADLEAGLDFADEDLHFVDQEDMLRRFDGGLARLTLARQQLTERALADRPFRVALAGPANAGKSSLFNALTGGQALVSPQAGTTRDYLTAQVVIEGVTIELIDTAGWQEARDGIEAQALDLGHEQSEAADLVLFCQSGPEVRSQKSEVRSQRSEVGCQDSVAPLTTHHSPLTTVLVRTKSDLGAAPGGLATSVVSGEGLDALRGLIADRARSWRSRPLAPSLSRCRHHVDRALDHLKRAHELVLFNEPPELVALELRGVLDQLGEMVGAVHTDDLLDRIFSRFCIGK